MTPRVGAEGRVTDQSKDDEGSIVDGVNTTAEPIACRSPAAWNGTEWEEELCAAHVPLSSAVFWPVLSA
jgi:hypothetical protein